MKNPAELIFYVIIKNLMNIVSPPVIRSFGKFNL
jgi:hypothetical protein